MEVGVSLGGLSYNEGGVRCFALLQLFSRLAGPVIILPIRLQQKVLPLVRVWQYWKNKLGLSWAKLSTKLAS